MIIFKIVDFSQELSFLEGKGLNGLIFYVF